MGMRTVVVVGSVVLLAACRRDAEVGNSAPAQPPRADIEREPLARADSDEINPRLLRRFQAVDGDTHSEASSPDKVALGRVLFHDKRLSRNQQISCSSCHVLNRFGMDGKSTSEGVDGRRGGRNAPSVFNAATHIAQFWDGRAPDVERQAAGPIMNPLEMAMPSEQAVVAVLAGIPGYVEMFRKAFPADDEAISLKHVGEAIGAFERGLVTTSRWDRFIAGDTSALTAQEKHGLRVFLDAGCMACHTGPQVGGSMFQKLGAVIPWPNQNDKGRGAVTQQPTDQMVFKVPSLKNIAQTAPYFHDGSAADLEGAIRKMGHFQLGIELTADEVSSIVAWMRSMTGEIDPKYTAAPELPPGPSTVARRL